MGSILIINPNSSEAVTEAIREAASRGLADGWSCEAVQLDEGPPTVDSEEDEVFVAPLVEARINREQDKFDAFVIACGCDPGLRESRRISRKPVVGIGQASLFVASALGDHFGLINVHSRHVPWKLRQVAAYGLASRCVAVEPAETGVLDGVQDGADFSRHIAAGHRAAAKGADVLAFTCAGFIRARSVVQESVGLPVVEPIWAAMTLLRR
jgi:Asp/Glu/hydantoin racemase